MSELNNAAVEATQQAAVEVVKKIDPMQIGVGAAAAVGVVSVVVAGVFGVKKLINKIKKGKDVETAEVEQPAEVETEEAAEVVAEDPKEDEKKKK